MKKKLLGGAALLVGLVVLVVAATALATDSSGFSTEQLSLGRFGETLDLTTNDARRTRSSVTTIGGSDVYVVRNTVVPGGHSGWHTHPGPSLITVKEGTATLYDSDDPTCTPHMYPAGTGVIDPGRGHVHLLRNEGSVNLVTVTVQILPAGAPRRIDAPRLGNCPF